MKKIKIIAGQDTITCVSPDECIIPECYKGMHFYIDYTTVFIDEKGDQWVIMPCQVFPCANPNNDRQEYKEYVSKNGEPESVNRCFQLKRPLSNFTCLANFKPATATITIDSVNHAVREVSGDLVKKEGFYDFV